MTLSSDETQERCLALKYLIGRGLNLPLTCAPNPAKPFHFSVHSLTAQVKLPMSKENIVITLQDAHSKNDADAEINIKNFGVIRGNRIHLHHNGYNSVIGQKKDSYGDHATKPLIMFIITYFPLMMIERNDMEIFVGSFPRLSSISLDDYLKNLQMYLAMYALARWESRFYRDLKSYG